MTHVDFTTLSSQIGQEIAVSPWLDVTQERINAFAEATEDRQWIHVDPVKAATQSPFKSTIAHGFLTLSLVSVLLRTAMAVTVKMAINYGVNRVRFVSAVPVGSRLRGRFTPRAVDTVDGGGVQVTWNITVEREGQEKPAAVVEWIVRYYP
jgi:acyl dehydratase